MEKLFAVAFLMASVTAFSRAQNPSPTASPLAAPPQNPGALVAASPTPAPTPAPVLETMLVVSIPEQKLAVVVNDKVYRTYKISTSRYGQGDALGSWCTPIGHLAVATKIGASVPVGGVFQARRYTGEVLSVNAPGRDPIVSRIIWLRGLDYANRNAFHRCIYIHGTPQEDMLGKKSSYGCIRMGLNEVIEVFNWIAVGTEVAIFDKPITRGVKELVDDRRLMATNTTKADTRTEVVR
jgi:lipoprotein-anchoring transpeptidase ErfK/SrfK